MAHSASSERIEQYLLNRMTETEKAAFQLELLQNKQLREEVKTMRRWQKTLVAEQQINQGADASFFNWKWLLPLLLVPIIGFYFWKTAAVESTIAPQQTPIPETSETPIATPKKLEIKEEIPVKTEEIEEKQEIKPVKQHKKERAKPKVEKPKIYAAADPVDLVPNPLVEQMMTGIRGNEVVLNLTAPTKEGKVKWSEKGVNISFKGTATTDENELPGLNVLIFSNKKADFENWNHLINKPLIFEKTTDGFTFSNQVSLSLKKGLYYYLIENQETEMPVLVGKFFVE